MLNCVADQRIHKMEERLIFGVDLEYTSSDHPIDSRTARRFRSSKLATAWVWASGIAVLQVNMVEQIMPPALATLANEAWRRWVRLSEQCGRPETDLRWDASL
jgi:hypothetical protein